MEVELNFSYAFDAITESGKSLTPITGPGYQGLKNLGNSCYMNSAVQVLFSIEEVKRRYGARGGSADPFDQGLIRSAMSSREMGGDVLTQIAKLGVALTSGAYAVDPVASPVDPDNDTDTDSAEYSDVIAPRMFKSALASNNGEFLGGKQQDSSEYLVHVLNVLERAEQKGIKSGRLDEGSATTSKLFAFNIDERIRCVADNKVGYKDQKNNMVLTLRIPMDKAKAEATKCDQHEIIGEKRKADDAADDAADADAKLEVGFSECINAWKAGVEIEKNFPHLKLNKNSAGVQTQSIANFPPYLLIEMQRYVQGTDWAPKKLEVCVEIPTELDLTGLRTVRGEGEELVPEEKEEEEEEEDNDVDRAPQLAVVSVNEGALAQLMDMGFGKNGCTRALMTVGGSDVEAAMNWVFEHSQDMDFDDEIKEGEFGGGGGGGKAGGKTGEAVDETVVASLVENLGMFTAEQVRDVLRVVKTSERTADWLFSHMDSLDADIVALKGGVKPPAVLEEGDGGGEGAGGNVMLDGEGKYELVGFISHIGKNLGSGHYVCHILKDGKWTIFNDEKVALSESPPLKHGYLYLFKRVPAGPRVL